MAKPIFSLGQIVYHRIVANEAGIITGLLIRPTGITYGVTWSDMEEVFHYDIELSSEKSFTEPE